MAYNLHSQWEDMVFCAALLYDTAAQTKYNGYSVHDATKSMLSKTVNTEKFNLGLSLFGATFTFKDKRKTVSGSPVFSPGKRKGAMACFEAKKLEGNLHLGDAENQVFDRFNRLTTQGPKMDDIDKCIYIVVNEDQWVNYDSSGTSAFEIGYLKKAGFGDISIWSMDSDSANQELTKSIHKSLTTNSIESKSLHPGDNGEDSMGNLNGNGDVYIGSAKEAQNRQQK